jgi:hypothetical protein
MTMELIERYLESVKFGLPRQQKDDIIAELSDDIHAEVEEKEAALGRKLTEAEVEEILKQRGHPLLVANRFLPQESLIGPVFFPIYRFVLKIFAFGYLLPATLVWIGLMVFSPSYRFEHTHPSWFTAFASLFSYLWFTFCLVVVPVTIAFAVLERNQARVHFFDRWSPRKLPPVRNPNLIPRSSSSFELAVNLIFFVWFAICLHSPAVRIGSVLQFTLGPLWPWFFWGYLLLAAFNAAFACEKLLHPSWTVGRAALKLLSDAAGAALFCWLMKANLLAGIAVTNLPAQQAIAITQAINGWMARLFPWAIVIGLVIVATDVYRIVRLRLAGRRSPA